MNKIRLFCFPYAGGAAMVFSKWKKYLNDSIELHPLELNGRGRKFSLPYYNSIGAAVADIYDEIKEHLDDEPYAFFGHSMGSTLAYELALKIMKTEHPQPKHAFFSGRYPPHIQREDRMMHLLSEEEFVEEVLKLGGTPRELFADQELLNIYMKILRADYRMLETYSPSVRGDRFHYDITALNGNKDSMASVSEVSEWKHYTDSTFKLYEFQGGHFYINDNMESVLKIINDTLMVYAGQ